MNPAAERSAWSRDDYTCLAVHGTAGRADTDHVEPSADHAGKARVLPIECESGGDHDVAEPTGVVGPTRKVPSRKDDSRCALCRPSSRADAGYDRGRVAHKVETCGLHLLSVETHTNSCLLGPHVGTSSHAESRHSHFSRGHAAYFTYGEAAKTNTPVWLGPPAVDQAAVEVHLPIDQDMKTTRVVVDVECATGGTQVWRDGDGLDVPHTVIQHMQMLQPGGRNLAATRILRRENNRDTEPCAHTPLAKCLPGTLQRDVAAESQGGPKPRRDTRAAPRKAQHRTSRSCTRLTDEH
eukprot:7378585-Prymnesium_polylepis.1